MTPEQFVAKWSKIQQRETAVSQSHFNDVCALVNYLFLFESDNSRFAEETRKSVTGAKIQALDDIHGGLDTAVLAAYHWSPNLSDEQILERFLTLNLERTNTQEES